MNNEFNKSNNPQEKSSQIYGGGGGGQYGHQRHNQQSRSQSSSRNANGSKRQTREQKNYYEQTNHRSGDDKQGIQSDSTEYQEKVVISSQQQQQQQIQVQILPQDDNWENMTAVTGDFSDFNDDVTEDGRSFHGRIKSNHRNVLIDMDNESLQNNLKPSGWLNVAGSYMRNYFGFMSALLISICAFVTPILFIVLPRLNINQQWQLNECGLECEGLLIGIAFKLFILLLGSWAIYARKPSAFLPRVYEMRALLIFLLFIMTFSFWLFYGVRIIDTRIQDYYKILQFTVSYVDVLLFIFVVSVFIIELRQLQPQYVVKIVRSPDGEQSEYTIGKISIQRAAVWILEQYYKDFGVYNPWLENAHRKRGAQLLQLEQAAMKKNKGRSNRSVKGFNQDDDKGGNNDDDYNEDAMSIKSRKMNGNGNGGGNSIVGGNFNANDRFYEEYEYERRLRKRRARLLTSTEDAFTHIRRINGDAGSIGNFEGNSMPSTVMDPFEAAQAIFTTIARDLRRYLRVTRQQPFFTRDSIVAHLANCISYDMSPKAFLQRYLNRESLVFNEKALVNASTQQNNKFSSLLTNGVGSHGVNYHMNLKTLDQSWILICDTALYQNVEDNLMFVLKQNEVCLMCTFKRLPRFNLVEDILDPKRNKFVLKLNSETTV